MMVPLVQDCLEITNPKVKPGINPEVVTDRVIPGIEPGVDPKVVTKGVINGLANATKILKLLYGTQKERESN